MSLPQLILLLKTAAGQVLIIKSGHSYTKVVFVTIRSCFFFVSYFKHLKHYL